MMTADRIPKKIVKLRGVTERVPEGKTLILGVMELAIKAAGKGGQAT